MATISRAQKVRLGMFIGTGLVILFGAFILLAGRALLESRDFYSIRFTSPNVSLSGLEIGSDVRYSGIKIGRVERVRVAPGDVSVIEVSISVEGKTPIAVDSKATVAYQGITGLKYIELSRGSPESALRKPGDTIPEGASLFDDLTSRATAIAEKLDMVLANLQKMTGPETQAGFQRVLGATAGMLEDNRSNITEIVTNVRRTTEHLNALSKRGVSVANRADALMADLQVAGDRVSGAMATDGSVTLALEKTDKLVDRVNMLILRSEGDLDITLRHLREASANLSDFSLALKENPTILINSGAQVTDEKVGR